MRDFSIYEEEGGKISSEDFAEQAMLVYEKFLEGRIECDGIDIDFITTPKGEPDKRYDTQYAVFDCDGNGEADCRAGKIDMIITKSISRYSVSLWH